ncbi:hypothetical protein [Sorangium sp. So ce887]|uniref:hypothetical protein n=1 Tax=Sorangium sp. So ce887 TaxID=3133324 RepID=UPI003F635E19
MRTTRRIQAVLAFGMLAAFDGGARPASAEELLPGGAEGEVQPRAVEETDSETIGSAVEAISPYCRFRCQRMYRACVSFALPHVCYQRYWRCLASCPPTPFPFSGR